MAAVGANTTTKGKRLLRRLPLLSSASFSLAQECEEANPPRYLNSERSYGGAQNPDAGYWLIPEFDAMHSPIWETKVSEQDQMRLIYTCQCGNINAS